MDCIVIKDLEVAYRVGVPDEERARPQRLLISVQLAVDMTRAADTDDLAATINYYEVSQRLLRLGEGRSWKLIESLAVEIATTILREFLPREVRVTVKKFIIPEARYVSVDIRRSLGAPISSGE